VAETRQHGQDDGCGTDAAGKPVRVGKEIALQRGCPGIDITYRHSLLSDSEKQHGIDAQPQVENARDVETVRALGDHYRMKVNITLDQSSVNINGTEGTVKEVLTGAQGMTRAASPVTEQKREAMPKHSASHQQIRNLGGLRPGFDDEQQVPGVSAIRGKQIGNYPERCTHQRHDRH
jgi:hypothetical protein